MSFTKKIISAMLLGVLLGIFFNLSFNDESPLKNIIIFGVFDTIGLIFLTLLKMMVLPLIFVSIICGTISISDPSKLTRLGLKTLSLYLLSTILAISIALLVSNSVSYNFGDFDVGTSIIKDLTKIESNQQNFILNFIPENFFFALSSGNVLQVLFFALFLGITSSIIRDDIPEFVKLMENLNKIFIKIVFTIITITPIAVFCLLAKTFAIQGSEVLYPLIQYFLTVVGALLVHFFFSYALFLYFLSDLNIKCFYKKLKKLIVFTFSTSSSNASIPYTLDTVNKDYGIKKSFSSFSIPLGATINMDGTAIMQGCAAYFLAAYYGISLELYDYLTIITTATLASIGTAGIPSAGIIMLSIILEQIGIPVEGIALLLGIDRLLDMMRTSINVSGDVCITCVVAKSEELIDDDVFRASSD